jgi:hypothetical protein
MDVGNSNYYEFRTKCLEEHRKGLSVKSIVQQLAFYGFIITLSKVR